MDEYLKRCKTWQVRQQDQPSSNQSMETRDPKISPEPEGQVGFLRFFAFLGTEVPSS